MLFSAMRARMGTAVTVAMVLVACARSEGGTKAQAFTLETPSGSTLTVDPTVDHRGKILIFWASW